MQIINLPIFKIVLKLDPWSPNFILLSNFKNRGPGDKLFILSEVTKLEYHRKPTEEIKVSTHGSAVLLNIG